MCIGLTPPRRKTFNNNSRRKPSPSFSQLVRVLVAQLEPRGTRIHEKGGVIYGGIEENIIIFGNVGAEPIGHFARRFLRQSTAICRCVHGQTAKYRTFMIRLVKIRMRLPPHFTLLALVAWCVFHQAQATLIPLVSQTAFSSRRSGRLDCEREIWERDHGWVW